MQSTPALNLRDRLRAGSIHLGISMLIAASIFAVIYEVWFPGDLFEGAGGRGLFLLIMSVDATLGPLLTFIVFDRRKKSLRYDLATIAVLQLAALGYGVWVLFEARPAFIAFVKDRFELVRANGIPPENYAAAADRRFASAPLTGPRLVGVRLPTNPKEQLMLIDSAMHGMDAQFFPRYYVPYEQVLPDVKSHAKTIATLRRLNPGHDAQIDAYLAAAGLPEKDVRFLPMRTGKGDIAMLVDARTGRTLRMVLLRPW
jgi:hypothetical protein